MNSLQTVAATNFWNASVVIPAFCAAFFISSIPSRTNSTNVLRRPLALPSASPSASLCSLILSPNFSIISHIVFTPVRCQRTSCSRQMDFTPWRSPVFGTLQGSYQIFARRSSYPAYLPAPIRLTYRDVPRFYPWLYLRLHPRLYPRLYP